MADLVTSVIAAALKERRPRLSLHAAQLEAELVLQRLREGGYSVNPAERDRIVLLPDGLLQCMVCENVSPLSDAVPLAEHLSEEAKRSSRKSD